MKRYIGIAFAVVAVVAIVWFLAARSAARQRETSAELDLTRIQRDYLERVGWMRSNPDEKSYKDEVNPFLRAWFKEMDAHVGQFGGNKDYDDYLQKLEGKEKGEKGGKGGKERRGPDPKAYYESVRALFDKMRQGTYEPVWSASDRGMRLDVFTEDRMSEGTPQVRWTVVLWGAQRGLREDGKVKKMVTSASFQTKWSYKDDAGNLVAEMNAQDPSMKIDYPESFIEAFPPQMVFGHYDLDLVPANATKAEVTFIVTSRAATGGEAVATFVWKLDVPQEWRLKAGEEWKGAEESTRTQEEINPEAAAADAAKAQQPKTKRGR